MGVRVEKRHPSERVYKVTGIFPAIVVNQGEVVSLTAEEEVLVSYPYDKEGDAITGFRELGPVRAVGDGPWVHPRTAVSFIVKEVDDHER